MKSTGGAATAGAVASSVHATASEIRMGGLECWGGGHCGEKGIIVRIGPCTRDTEKRNFDPLLVLRGEGSQPTPWWRAKMPLRLGLVLVVCGILGVCWATG